MAWVAYDLTLGSAFQLKPIDSTLNFGWYVQGSANDLRPFMVLGDSGRIADAVRSSLPGAGYSEQGGVFTTTTPFPSAVRFDGDLIWVSSGGSSDPDVAAGPNTARDNTHVSALAGCLAGADVVRLSMRDATAISVAARADTNEAWSCIHAPEDTAGYATTITPRRPEVTIKDQTIDGAVIRTTLNAKYGNPTIPDAALVMLNFPETQGQGF